MPDPDDWRKISLPNGSTIVRAGSMQNREMFTYSNDKVEIKFSATHFLEMDDQPESEVRATDRWLVSMTEAAVRLYAKYYGHGEPWILQQIDQFKNDVSAALLLLRLDDKYPKPIRVDFQVDRETINRAREYWLGKN